MGGGTVGGWPMAWRLGDGQGASVRVGPGSQQKKCAPLGLMDQMGRAHYGKK
jgi:hypothetical protein